MIKVVNIISILLLVIAFSCSENKNKNIDKFQNDSLKIDTSKNSKSFNDSVVKLEQNQTKKDIFTTVKFNEFSLSINKFSVFENDTNLNQIQKDTVKLDADLTSTIEEQIISISNNQLTDLKIEQCYETSLSVQDEGPHCDLSDWKHYKSDWKFLKTNKEGHFVSDKYSEKESQFFPKVSLVELKKAIKQHCGDRWLKSLENIKSYREDPCSIGISRYYLRITGKQKKSGKTITKLIIIEVPMGC